MMNKTWEDDWRRSLHSSSCRRIIDEKGWSNDRFWREWTAYAQVVKLGGYPGKLVNLVQANMEPGSTLLDIGAGTGAFALPLAATCRQIIALDPSRHQLNLLAEQAQAQSIDNIVLQQASWPEAAAALVEPVDYCLASYSMFTDDIRAFLSRLAETARRGFFIVFRAGPVDPLRTFCYGPAFAVDYLCLYNILHDLGYLCDVHIVERQYMIPLSLVIEQYRFSHRTPAEIEYFLRENGRLVDKDGEQHCRHRVLDALLYWKRSV